jgi:hypothetical protein
VSFHLAFSNALLPPPPPIPCHTPLQERTPEEAAKRVASLLKRDKARQKRIAAAGIDYEYEPLAAQQPQKAKKTKFA